MHPLRLTSLSLLLFVSCADVTEAPRVTREVVSDGAAIMPVVTNLGYEVTLDVAQLALSEVQFTIAGEAHASGGAKPLAWLIPSAHAHPGHSQGGEVTGELPGRHVVDWLGEAGQRLGEATLITGAYTAANFTFTRAREEDGVGADDPLLGHTARLAGTARLDGATVRFEALIDAPVGRVLVGAPFEAQVREGDGPAIGLQLAPRAPGQQTTLFDGLDFSALEPDTDGTLRLRPDGPTADAYNRLRRVFMTHDHFLFTPQ